MNIYTQLPVPALSPYIRKYLIIESDVQRVNTLLPDTSLVMAFRYKGHVSYGVNGSTKTLPLSILSGLRKSVRLINYSKGAGNILVHFKEAGANAFIKEPLHELMNETVALDYFNGHKNIADLEEQLAATTNHPQRINLVEHYLLARLCNPRPDNLILAALEKIHSTKGMIRIKDLAGAVCLSQDAFEKRFRKIIGLSPKQFAYVVRMKSVIGSGLKDHTLAETAFDAGYFDQPHFNKDFKLFTGQTPSDFLKSPRHW